MIKSPPAENERYDTPVVFFPDSYLEVTKMAEYLIASRSIIINLTRLDFKDRFRVLDFICGVSFVVKARRELLDSGVYLFSIQNSR